MRWFGFILWCCLVLGLSSIPGSGTPRLNIPNADKIVHFGIFFLGALILTEALRHSFRWKPIIVIPVVIITMSVLGAADEWYQLRTPNRTGADFGDWIADTAGGISGVIALYALHGITRRFTRTKSDSGTQEPNREGQ